MTRDNMKLVGVIQQNYPDVISVSWDTSSVCNYRCSYCDTVFHDGKNKFPDLNVVERFMTELAAQSNKKLFFEMKGGEPTLWRQFDDFLALCHERNWGVGLVTNMTKPLAWWENKLQYLGQVTMSLHPESYKLEELIEKMIFVHKHRRSGAMYMVYPPLFDQIVKDVEMIYEKIPALYMRMTVLSVPNVGDTLYEYTPEMENFISKNNSRPSVHSHYLYPDFPFYDTNSAHVLNTKNESEPIDTQELKLKRQNHWAGWKCRVGMDRIHIATDGTIFRGQCLEGGAIGNLHTGQWDLPKSPITCSKKSCFCGGEILLKKWDPLMVSLIDEGVRG